MMIAEGIVDKIITATMGENQHGAVMRFLDYFNEGMGVYAITRMTLYKWRMGAAADPRILTRAVEVYAPDDPRHQMARALLDRQNEAANAV